MSQSKRKSVFHFRTAGLIARQTTQELSRSFGLYVLLTLGWGAVVFSIRSTLQVINSGYAVVLGEPLSLPILSILTLTGLYTALMAGISAVREREQGILETYFYGPITHLEYLVGKFLAHWAAYGVFAVVFLLGVGLVARWANLAFSPNLFWITVISIGMAAALISGGLLLSTLTHSQRGMVLLFLAIVLIFVAIELGKNILVAVVSTGKYINLIGVRDTVAVVSTAIDYISPVGYFLRSVEALLREDTFGAAWPCLVLALICAAMLAIAAGIHQRRGVTQ